MSVTEAGTLVIQLKFDSEAKEAPHFTIVSAPQNICEGRHSQIISVKFKCTNENRDYLLDFYPPDLKIKAFVSQDAQIHLSPENDQHNLFPATKHAIQCLHTYIEKQKLEKETQKLFSHYRMPNGVDCQITDFLELRKLFDSKASEPNLYLALDIDEVLVSPILNPMRPHLPDFKLIPNHLKEIIDFVKTRIPNTHIVLLTHCPTETIDGKKDQLKEAGLTLGWFTHVITASVSNNNPSKGLMLRTYIDGCHSAPTPSHIVMIDDDSKNLLDMKREFGQKVTTVQFMAGFEARIEYLAQLSQLDVGSFLAKAKENVKRQVEEFRQFENYRKASIV